MQFMRYQLEGRNTIERNGRRHMMVGEGRRRKSTEAGEYVSDSIERIREIIRVEERERDVARDRIE